MYAVQEVRRLERQLSVGRLETLGMVQTTICVDQRSTQTACADRYAKHEAGARSEAECPFAGIKEVEPGRARRPKLVGCIPKGVVLDVDEFEQALAVEPGINPLAKEQ